MSDAIPISLLTWLDALDPVLSLHALPYSHKSSQRPDFHVCL